MNSMNMFLGKQDKSCRKSLHSIIKKFISKLEWAEEHQNALGIIDNHSSEAAL